MYAHWFVEFDIPYPSYYGILASLDYNIISGLSRAYNLTDLNLTKCVISSTCFIIYLPNLECPNLTECLNLCEADFFILSSMNKLEFLYLSFDFISVDAIAIIVTNKPALVSLEVYGLGLTIADFHTIISPCYKSLVFAYVSIVPSVEEDECYDMVHTHYIDLCTRICKLDFKD
jgi:hypothetical protein